VAVLRSANLGPSVFLVFLLQLCQTWSVCYKILYTWCRRQCKQVMQIWLLYDFYFLVCANIVAKPYVQTYGLATIYAYIQYMHTRESRKLEIIKSPNLQHLFMSSVAKICGKICRPSGNMMWYKIL